MSTKVSAVTNLEKKTLTIVLPLNTPPEPSKSGNTLLVASTRGAAQTDVEVNGQTLQVNCNAYIYATSKEEREKKRKESKGGQ